MIDLGNLPVWGDPIDPDALRQIKNCQSFADRVAMMADHHVGYSVPIGGVLAFSEHVSPSGVGYDIGCGNKCVRTDLLAADVKKDIEKVMDLIASSLSFGMGLKNKEKVDHALFDKDAWRIRAVASLKQLAREQMGTIGSGNHYVDLLEDYSGLVWVGVHFGSRGFGYKTAQFFLSQLKARNDMFSDPACIHANSILGEDYIECMRLAGDYAYASRDWVCAKVVSLLGGRDIESVHNHHNFAWRETHSGEDFWVVRKGATPSFPGQRGFVGGSMGDDAFILEGVDSEESRAALYSTVHGAGRVMSRKKAKENIDEKSVVEWLKNRNVVLRGGGLDEAPQAYKRIDEVLAHHAATVKILYRLRPFGVLMAGKDEKDLYKD